MAENGSEEEILIEAEQKAAQAYREAPGVATQRAWSSTKKALREFYREQESAGSGERFKNIEQAAAFLVGEGYVVSTRTIRNHQDKPGFPRRQKADGSYLKSEIEAYAAQTWENPRRVKPVDSGPGGDYTDQVKRETARKLKLDNDIKEGKYLLKSEEEQRDALLLYGIKRSVENWGSFIIQDLIALAAAELGDEAAARIGRITPELLTRYRSQHADLFDKFAEAGFIEVPDAD